MTLIGENALNWALMAKNTMQNPIFPLSLPIAHSRGRLWANGKVRGTSRHCMQHWRISRKRVRRALRKQIGNTDTKGLRGLLWAFGLCRVEVTSNRKKVVLVRHGGLLVFTSTTQDSTKCVTQIKTNLNARDNMHGRKMFRAFKMK